MSQYFPEPRSLGGRVKVELDLSNYATKTDVIWYNLDNNYLFVNGK